MADRKSTGSHFTPPELAQFVSDRILSASAMIAENKELRVLDPACGDGELLLALAMALSERKWDLQRVVLVGVDTDLSSLAIARTRLEEQNLAQVVLEHADFLSGSPMVGGQLTLDALNVSRSLQEPFDLIIANPPYVRTQVLGATRAQELAEAFDLSGRVDLYYAFLVAVTHRLKPGGILGVITSNRFLSTKSGADVRSFLATEYEIVDICDLGDTKLFEAAVLPAIFVGRKRGANNKREGRPARFLKVYETATANKNDTVTSVGDIYEILRGSESGVFRVGERQFEATVGTLQLPDRVDDPWSMVTKEERAWMQRVEQGSQARLGELFKVRVGIKTTADEVFIKTDWNTLRDEVRPEPTLLHRLLSQDDAARWLPLDQPSSAKMILYTHEIRDGKRQAIDLAQYPRAAAYLESHRPRLEGRKYVLQAKRKWFEIWVPQDPSAWAKPKVVFPDISAEPRFFFDDRGCMVDGNCYWIAVDREDDLDLLFLVQGVANSKVMTRYHDLAFNNKLYAGRRRYLTQYVEKYPIPPSDSPSSRRVISLVKQLVRSTSTPDERRALEALIDAAVEQAFGLIPGEGHG
ncbi:MAG: HsdM family class I SAM-dependent methyltransferase [Bacillota bacterium]